MPPRQKLQDLLAGAITRLRPRDYDIPGGFARIYHHHVRKTGGTSLDSAFWGLIGLDLTALNQRLVVRRAGRAFVHHRIPLIERGGWFFASSHLAAHRLTLPPRTFTITVLRDPLARLLSHYRMLVWARDCPDAHRREPFLRGLTTEIGWLGGSFGDFLERAPREHLLRQLSMFSARYDPAEAAEAVLACNAVCFTESLARDVAALAWRLELPLESRHERRVEWEIAPRDGELERARAMLAPEGAMLERVRAGLSA